MRIASVTDKEFHAYGEVVEGYDFGPLLDTLKSTTEAPEDEVIYVPSDENLEALEVFSALRDGAYGGLPIEIGYCNGTNTMLNCLEYHRGSEVNIAADDVILMVAQRKDVDEDFRISTDKVVGFRVPAGMGVLLNETTLHYAPARPSGSFRVVIVLPKGTNTEKPDLVIRNREDKLLWANNKWLIAHKDTSEAAQGAWVGLEGENLSVAGTD